MTNPKHDPSFEPMQASRRTERSHSAVRDQPTLRVSSLITGLPFAVTQIRAHRGDVPSKHDEYLVQLQERNRLLKAYQHQHPPKDTNLKQRETGFQIYLNGAHSARPRRPPSIISKTSCRNARRTTLFVRSSSRRTHASADDSFAVFLRFLLTYSIEHDATDEFSSIERSPWMGSKHENEDQDTRRFDYR